MLKWFADRLARTGEEVRKDERGFTLIELLVVVIIIGILAAIAIPTFLGQRDSAQNSAAEATARNYATAANGWLVDGNESDFADVSASEVRGFQSGLPTQSDGADIEVNSINSDEDFEVVVDSESGDTITYSSEEGRFL